MIIDPRNELEHLYKKPSKEIAQYSVQLAELYLRATQEDIENGAIIVIDSAFLYGYGVVSDNICFDFHGFSNHPMFVVDIFKKEMKIILPKERALNYAKIDSFNINELFELSKELRKPKFQSTTTIPPRLVKELFEESSI